MLEKLIQTRSDPAVTIVRIMLGLVFFPHGAQKMLGWFGGGGFSGTMKMFENGMHIPAFFAFLAIAAEFFGAIGLIFGFFSRIAAFGLFVNMLVAIAKVHYANGFFMNWTGKQAGEGFEYHLLVLGMTAAIMIKGSGAVSVDQLIHRRITGSSTLPLELPN